MNEYLGASHTKSNCSKISFNVKCKLCKYCHFSKHCSLFEKHPANTEGVRRIGKNERNRSIRTSKTKYKIDVELKCYHNCKKRNLIPTNNISPFGAQFKNRRI